ncbi:MAG: DUF4402 domain-containing protein [Balneolaceae bacterium]|nr:DUF4402 domain-containing protein [Balneolaceae bacterium]
MGKPSLAQDLNNVSIRVTAEVFKTIELTTIRNIQFGEVQTGQEQIIISPILDSNAGKMVASGIPESRIRVSYLEEWELTNDSNDHTLTFYYDLAGNMVDNQNTAELLQTDNRGLQLNKDGEYYFWVGGRVDISNAQPGNYEGEFTIEIEYM